jgi:multisubunit Na+/H+ antiporter MnhB subunit
MKKLQFLTASILFFLLATLSSCEAIKGIFKAGMGFGIFLVVAVIAIIVFIAMKVGGKKN